MYTEAHVFNVKKIKTNLIPYLQILFSRKFY